MLGAMTDPGDRLLEALEALGVTQTELARRLGFAGYRTVRGWVEGRGFNPRNRGLVIQELGLPRDWFETDAPLPPEHQEILPDYRDAWLEFMGTRQAKAAAPEHLRVLAQRRFPGMRPTAMSYQLELMALQQCEPEAEDGQGGRRKRKGARN